MAPNRGKPIERHPTMPVPRNWGALQQGIPYRPRDDPKQEDRELVVRKFAVGVKELIYFNFMTDNPDEVNWYLRRHVGCEKISPSGNNWMFSRRATPGYIYIPPADDQAFTYDPEPICSWSPKLEEAFIRRLHAIAQGMPGNKGHRIKRLMQVITNAGYPGWKGLWYYNDMVMKAFVDWKPTPDYARSPFNQPTGYFRSMARPCGTRSLPQKREEQSIRWGCGASMQ